METEQVQPAIYRSESMLNHGRQIPTRRSSSKKRSAIGLSGKSVRNEKADGFCDDLEPALLVIGNADLRSGCSTRMSFLV